MAELKVATFNARGLKDITKRRSLFRFLHVNYADHIVALQEVHWSTRDVSYIRNEWGAPVFCAPGHNAKVAIMIPRGLIGVCDISELRHVSTERTLLVHMDFDKFNIYLCAVYAPTQGHLQQQVEFFTRLRETLENLPTDENSHDLFR